MGTHLLPGGSPEFGDLSLEHVAGLLGIVSHGLGLLQLLHECFRLTLGILFLPAQALDLARQLVHLVLQPLPVAALVVQLASDILRLVVTPATRNNSGSYN